MDDYSVYNFTGFDWDEWNQFKNHVKHNVSTWECEQIFFNEPLLVYEDNKHSDHEARYYALGHTDDNRRLFIAFTLRKLLIRVISARDMSKKERDIYDEAKKNSRFQISH